MTDKTGGERLANGEKNTANIDAFVALPSREALGRKVTVYCPETEKAAEAVPVMDVGPHSTSDPYWENGTRPQAEKGKSDRYRRARNKAGIDLSLRLCRDLGLHYPYKGEVIWWFVDKNES